MSSPIYMPKLGLTMTEGTLTEWLVNTGETVTKGQPVASIETDKIETEIEAEAEGRLHQLCKSGEIFECGVVLGWVLEEDEEPPETPEIPEVKNDQITTIEQNETPGKETKTKYSNISQHNSEIYYLLINRWVGIDGVMAVTSKKQILNKMFLLNSFKERAHEKQPTFYDITNYFLSNEFHKTNHYC